ncbi:MAG: DUF1579 family protein [Saprospiraceae bacterium]|nr:DUF1579 family protein [Saprospiraceae bacterium]
MTAQQNTDPWTEYMTPTDIHTLIGQYTGDFDMEIAMSRGEGKNPIVINIPSTHQMILGARFLEMKQKGDMMGMAYESFMTLGFNTIDKKMALTTITNMGTGTLALFGNWDEINKKATLYGSLTNPVSKHNIQVKQIIDFSDSNTLVIESYDTEGEQAEKKTVVYTLKRKI